jgi:P4 family phage/plasmid primase-like protien
VQNEEEDPDKKDERTKIIDKLNVMIVRLKNIYERLGKTSDKKNIMSECKDLFYDSEFFKQLDNNPYLLCCKNGVLDFKENVFRRGMREDYLSKSTNIEYHPVDHVKHFEIIREINDFMNKLFPIPELKQYMWEHLASTLIGISPNQTFNMYIGIGNNGKSVLVDLMTLVLGEYKGDVPLTLVTGGRSKIGGLSPEIVGLKGLRYAVMQEPTKGDKMNEGIMKQITSGVDPLQGRTLHTEPICFIPQFKLVVCANEFIEIKSQDHGTWRRIRVVDFVTLFTDTPVDGDPDKPYQFLIDRNIKEKFKDWKEVFLSMLADIAFKKKAMVQDCKQVLASSNAYRIGQDSIAQFIEQRIIKDVGCDGLTKAGVLAEFKHWFNEENPGKAIPVGKEINAAMEKKFGKQEKGRWKNIRFITDLDFENEVVDGGHNAQDYSDL